MPESQGFASAILAALTRAGSLLAACGSSGSAGRPLAPTRTDFAADVKPPSEA